MARGGLRGTSQAVLHGVFQDRLAGLKAAAAANYAAAQGQGAREWDLPAGLQTDLFDIATLHEPAHNRDAINANFETVMGTMKQPGTTGDAIALLYQCDLLASEERALRLRHSSVCRSLMHAAGRRYGLGHGTVFDNMRDQAAKMIQVGGGAAPQ